MTLKSDAKFEEELTGALKNGTRNLANFYQKTQKSQNGTLMGSFYQKQKTYELDNEEKMYENDNEE